MEMVLLLHLDENVPLQKLTVYDLLPKSEPPIARAGQLQTLYIYLLKHPFQYKGQALKRYHL